MGTWRGVLFRPKGTWRGVFMLIVIIGKIKVGCWLVIGSGVNYQLHPMVPKLKSSSNIWTGVFHSKFQLIGTKDGRA